MVLFMMNWFINQTVYMYLVFLNSLIKLMWVGVLYGVYNSEPKASDYKHHKD